LGTLLAFNSTISKPIYDSAGSSKLHPVNFSSRNKTVSVNNNIQSDKGIPVETSHIEFTRRNPLKKEIKVQTNKIKDVRSIRE